MNNRAKATTAAVAAAAIAAGIYFSGSTPEPTPQPIDPDEPTQELTHALVQAIAPCGDDKAPGLSNLPGKAKARCRPGRRAPVCLSVSTPEGENIRDVEGWRTTRIVKELDASMCEDADVCRVDMSHCNEGRDSLAGYVSRIIRLDEEGEPVLSPMRFARCVGPCVCVEPPCVADIPVVVGSASGDWREAFCAEEPGHRECQEEEGER